MNQSRKPSDIYGQEINVGDILFIPVVVRSVRPTDEYSNLDVETMGPFYPALHGSVHSVNGKQCVSTGEIFAEERGAQNIAILANPQYEEISMEISVDQVKEYLKGLESRRNNASDETLDAEVEDILGME